MSGLFLPYRGRPATGVRINAAHPASVGLAAAFAFDEQVGYPRNLVANNTAYNPATSTPGLWTGAGYNMHNVGSKSFRAPVPATLSRSMLAGFVVPAPLAGSLTVFAGLTSSDTWTPASVIGLRLTEGGLYAYDYASFSILLPLVAPIGSMSTNVPYIAGQITHVPNGTSGTLYGFLNGASMGTAAIGNPPFSAWTGGPSFHPGFQATTTANVAFCVAYYWSRALEPAMMQELTSNPYALLTR